MAQTNGFPDRRSPTPGAWIERMQRGREMWDRFNGECLRWWHAATGGQPQELVK